MSISPQRHGWPCRTDSIAASVPGSPIRLSARAASTLQCLPGRNSRQDVYADIAGAHLGVIKGRSGFKHGSNRTGIACVGHRLGEGDQTRAGGLLLRVVLGKERGAVLGADIAPLAHALGRIIGSWFSQNNLRNTVYRRRSADRTRLLPLQHAWSGRCTLCDRWDWACNRRCSRPRYCTRRAVARTAAPPPKTAHGENGHRHPVRDVAHRMVQHRMRGGDRHWRHGPGSASLCVMRVVWSKFRATLNSSLKQMPAKCPVRGCLTGTFYRQ